MLKDQLMRFCIEKLWFIFAEAVCLPCPWLFMFVAFYLFGIFLVLDNIFCMFPSKGLKNK